MDLKPGDDLSYYLGPAATRATEAQCEELRRALREAELATRWDVGELEGCGKDTARAIARVDGERARSKP